MTEDTPRAALHRLPVQVLQRAARAAVYLVLHQVLQALVVRRPEEHLRVQLAASEPVVYNLQV